MARLKLNGKVMHPPGFWGTNKPVKGAQVKITDIDLPGRVDDVIWQGITDNNGIFQGEAAEWQDQLQVSPALPATPLTPAVPAKYAPDLTDLLVLTITVIQNTPAGQKQMTAPFPFAGDNVQVPVLVTWAPPDPVVKVNGNSCYTAQDVRLRVQEAMNANQPISIQVYGPDANTLIPLTQPTDQLKQWIIQQRQQMVGAFEIIVPGWAIGTFVILVGVSILTLSVGATAVLLAVAAALFITVVMGYRIKKVEQKTDVASGLNYINVELEKG
jgi:hypothetical protein